MFRKILYIIGGLIVLIAIAWFGGLRAAFAKSFRNGARIAFAKGEYSDAALSYQRAARFGFPERTEHAAALYRAGRIHEAERVFLDKDLTLRESVAYGVIKMTGGDDAAAKSSFQSVLDFTDSTSSPKYMASDLADLKALASYNLSLLYRRKGDTTLANRAFENAVEWSDGEAKEWSGPQPIDPRFVRLWVKNLEHR